MTREELNAAYLNTVYRVFCAEGVFSLSIGVDHPTFDAWCRRACIVDWAIITAWNPYSHPSTEADNIDANRRLKESLEKERLPHLHAEGQSRDTSWPAEESFFVWGLNEKKAIALGQKYGQNAIVLGRCGDPARLLWLD